MQIHTKFPLTSSSRENFPLHRRFSPFKILPAENLPSPPYPENVCILPSNKLNNGKSNLSPRAVEGHFISKDIIIWPFNYAEQKGYLKILIGRFLEKSSVGNGLFAFQSFWSLKKAIEPLISNGMSPLLTF